MHAVYTVGNIIGSKREWNKNIIITRVKCCRQLAYDIFISIVLSVFIITKPNFYFGVWTNKIWEMVESFSPPLMYNMIIHYQTDILSTGLKFRILQLLLTKFNFSNFRKYKILRWQFHKIFVYSLWKRNKNAKPCMVRGTYQWLSMLTQLLRNLNPIDSPFIINLATL